MPLILMIGLYLDADARRQAEFLECVRRNADNCFIDQIVVFIESKADPNLLRTSHPQLASPKVILAEHGRRLTYKDLFAYANTRLTGRRVIIANADIFFDQTLARLQGYDLSGKLLCLSRWDMNANGSARFFDYPASQDAWIFEAPLREFACAFFLGLPGCDNRLAWEAAQSGVCVLNPSRSIRAYHLHLTGVRRYSERDRIPGSTLSVHANFLETLWLWFVIPCMGRLNDLRQTIGSTTAQPGSSCVVIDYSCPDGTGPWVTGHHPEVYVVTSNKRRRFHAAEARNLGAAAVHDDGLICFLDADMVVAPEFSSRILPRFTPGSFLVPDQDGPGLRTTLVCRKTDFEKAGAFDESFVSWDEEVLDLRAALCRIGLKEQTFPASLLWHLPQHRKAADLSSISKRQKALEIYAAYRRAKTAAATRPVNFCDFQSAMRDFEDALSMADCATDEAPCAAVAFHENMGYIIARLESGATSHNNDERPFAVIPKALEGRQYTRVVACSASPIEVEFLSPGKLYVLVGTDWDGHRIATAWLREAGQREMMPPVLTRRHTAFEVWSLTGETGDRFELPTQIMLVASHLERM